MAKEVTVEDVAYVLQLLSEGKTYREIGMGKGVIEWRVRLACRWFGFSNSPHDRLLLLMRAAIGTGFIVGPQKREMEVSLNPFESQVLSLLFEGYTTRQIVSALQSEESSVEYTCRRLLAKCGAKTRAHLVALWTVLQRPAVQVHPQASQVNESTAETWQLTLQTLQYLSEGNSVRETADKQFITRGGINYRINLACEQFGIPQDTGERIPLLIRQAILSGFIVGPPRITTINIPPREFRVLQYLMAGYSNDQIMNATGMSMRNVNSTITHLGYRFGSRSRAHLVALATVLLEMPPPEAS